MLKDEKSLHAPNRMKSLKTDEETAETQSDSQAEDSSSTISEPTTNEATFSENLPVEAEIGDEQTISKKEQIDELVTAKTDSGSPNQDVQPLQPPISVMEFSRSLWRELPPSDLSDPVEHTDCDVFFRKAYPFVAIGASRRGRSHAHDAKYREDAFKIDGVRSWLLIAVADGQGAKSLARVGSNIAVRAAVSFMKLKLSSNSDVMEMNALLRSALTGAMAYAVAELAAEAALRERSIDDFSTTLLLAAFNMDPKYPFLGTVQVGDGGMAAKKQDGSIVVLGEADRGKYAGEALFLTNRETQLSWDKRVRIYDIKSPLNEVILATDGVWDDFNEPLGKLDTLFEVVEGFYQTGHEALLEWLNYERRSSFDDRTLVAFYPIRK